MQVCLLICPNARLYWLRSTRIFHNNLSEMSGLKQSPCRWNGRGFIVFMVWDVKLTGLIFQFNTGCHQPFTGIKDNAVFVHW